MPPQHKPPSLLWFMGGTSPPQITQRERETWQPRSSAHSRTQVIITQTFWASPRAVHRRPRALFAFRCSSAHVPALHRAPGQSPLCAVWAIFFFFFLPSFLSCLRNAVSPLCLPPGSPLLAGGLFLRAREALAASCWEPWRRGCGAGAGGTGGKCLRPL